MTEPRPVFAVVISAGLSAIPMVGGPLQTVFDAIEERTRHRAETTTREICESVGGADTVLSRIDKNPELEPLLSQAIEAATRTSMEAKRRLLAQAAAAALEDDQKVEPASLIVATLSQLEPVHIHALVRLAKAAKSSPDQDEIQRREVMRAASKVEPVPVLAALIQTGVAIATTTVGTATAPGLRQKKAATSLSTTSATSATACWPISGPPTQVPSSSSSPLEGLRQPATTRRRTRPRRDDSDSLHQKGGGSSSGSGGGPWVSVAMTAAWAIRRAWWLRWRSAAMQWARFWVRVLARRGIIAVRCPRRSARAGSGAGGSPVGVHSAGNSSALPGVVT